MRAVSSATCTSGEPVSRALRALALTISALSAVAMVMRFPWFGKPPAQATTANCAALPRFPVALAVTGETDPRRAVAPRALAAQRPRIIARARGASRSTPCVQPLRVARGEAPAQPALGLGAEGHARRQARGRARLHQALGEGQRVVLALRRGRRRTCRPAGSPPARRAAPPAAAAACRGRRAGARPGRARSRRRRASAASPPRCTNTGAQEVLNSISLPSASSCAARQHQPAQAPAGHQEALREAVHDDQAVVGAGDVQEAGRRRPVAEADALVDLVGDDPGAGARGSASRIACCSARVSVQPVGLFGALTSSTRVAGVTAASSASRSSRQAPSLRPQRHARARWRPGSPAAPSGWARPAPRPRPRRRRRPAPASPASAR